MVLCVLERIWKVQQGINLLHPDIASLLLLF